MTPFKDYLSEEHKDTIYSRNANKLYNDFVRTFKPSNEWNLVSPVRKTWYGLFYNYDGLVPVSGFSDGKKIYKLVWESIPPSSDKMLKEFGVNTDNFTLTPEGIDFLIDNQRKFSIEVYKNTESILKSYIDMMERGPTKPTKRKH